MRSDVDSSDTIIVDVTLAPPCGVAPILSGVAFHLRRGRTTAVLGPSGCGKTVLLQLLANRLNLDSFGFSGSISGAAFAPDASAAGVVLDALHTKVSYVPPDDVVFGFDTAREAISFRHRLAFGSSAAEAAEAAQRVIDELELTHCADTMISPGVGLRGISGGQRRRACIGMALVTHPAVLLLDEPTTGLDSHTARNVMAGMHDLARRYNCAVVQSLQQPGSDLFPHFDDLVILGPNGTLEYAGTTAGGPSSIPNRLGAAAREPAAASSSEGGVFVVLRDADGIHHEEAEPDAAPSPEKPRGPSATHHHGIVGTAPFATVAALVVARHYRALLRNPLALGMRVAQSLLMGLFFGMVFMDMEFSATNFKQIAGFLMVFVTAAFVPVQTGAAVFPMEKPVFLEEQKLPYRYPAVLYGLSKFLTESCAQLPLSVVYAAIMAGIIGLPSGNVGSTIVTALLQVLAAESFGFFVSTIAPPELAIGVITPVTAFVMLVLGTALATGKGDTKTLFDILKHACFLRNGFGALAADILPLVTIPCPVSGACYFDTAQDAIAFYDLESTTVGREWGLLAMWVVVFRAVSFVALTWLGWKQRIDYDSKVHRRAPSTTAAQQPQLHQHHDDNDTNAGSYSDKDRGFVVSPLVRYHAKPGPTDLEWDVEFLVRPRWGEASADFRTILHPMRGTAKAGRTLAIMGGSGAGKSTLIEALSLRLPPANLFTETARLTTISSVVEEVSGAPVRLVDLGAESRASIAFVHQDPFFARGLTAREVVEFAHDMVASSDTAANPNRAAVAQGILQQLGIAHVAQVSAELLSGSQKKRLAVGAALAQRRPILMLDEPTSGLDPEAAHQLLMLLEHLAHSERLTVMYTLHQPGDELLPHIDDLLLLSDGHVVFHGPLAEADVAFAGEFERDPGMNATDHYLSLSADPASRGRLIKAWGAREKAAADASAAKRGGDGIETASASVAARLLDAHAGMGCASIGVAALVRRAFRVSVLRVSKSALIGRFVALHIVMPLTIGVAMYQQVPPEHDDRGSSVVAVQNACFCFMMGLGFASSMMPLMDLNQERLAFLRDQEAASYSPVVYYASRSIASLPLEAAGLVVGAVIVYFMTGMRGDAGSFLIFVAAAFLLQQGTIGVGYAWGVAVHSIVVSASLTSLTGVLFATGAGIIIDPATISDSKWLHAVEFLSPTRQAMLIAVQEQMRHRPAGKQLVETVLGFNRSFDEPPVLWGVLVALTVCLRALPALLFWLLTRPGSYSRARKS